MKRAAVHFNQEVKLPDEILIMLGSEDQKASVFKVTTFHHFETAADSKFAVAYEIVTPHEDDRAIVYLIVVYSLAAKRALRILKCESLVTRMCTPADDQVLLAGTDVGSIALFDLNAFGDGSANYSDALFDYEGLLRWQMMNGGMDQDSDVDHRKALKKLRANFNVIGHTFCTDMLEENQHIAPIRQLEFVNKVGKGNA